MRTKLQATILAVGSVVFLWSAAAAAQTLGASTPAQQDALVLSTSSSATTTIVGGVILTIVLQSGNASLEQYLRHNRVALAADISFGGGATIADLADAFKISRGDRNAFGRLLRKHSTELRALLDPTRLDARRARQFVEVVYRNGVAAKIVDPALLQEG